MLVKSLHTIYITQYYYVYKITALMCWVAKCNVFLIHYIILHDFQPVLGVILYQIKFLSRLLSMIVIIAQ